jgi:hypothetical protein
MNLFAPSSSTAEIVKTAMQQKRVCNVLSFSLHLTLLTLKEVVSLL